MVEFHHFGRVVTDLSRSLSFYKGLIGFREIVREDLSGSEISAQVQLTDTKLKTVMLQLDGGPMLELIEFEHPRGAPLSKNTRFCDLGSDHLCVAVEDIQAEYERLIAASVNFTSKPQFVDGGYFKGDWVVFCHDPDGLTVELWQRAVAA